MKLKKISIIIMVIAMTLSLVPIAKVEASQILSQGDRSNELINIKTQLNWLGYDGITVDPFFGTFTERRVREFQADHGLSVTGEINQATRTRLNEEFTNAFRVGTRHDSVVQLKRSLNRVGFNGIIVSDLFGSFTEQRVREFQSYYGLNATGRFSVETARMLDNILSSPFQRGKRHDDTIQLKRNLNRIGFGRITVTNLYGSLTEEKVREFQNYYGLVENGIADPPTLAKIDEIISSPLQVGRSHNDLIPLKLQLNWLGYGNILVTNNFGSLTERRVKDFQTDHGLPVSGIIDRNTRQQIERQFSNVFRTGNRHESVEDLKRILNRLGFGGIIVSDLYGSFTAQRVREFQSYYGLNVNGRLDISTALKINEILSSPLQEGRRHPDTITLKRNLNSLGFGDIVVSDFYGSFTASRVRAFQRHYGLAVSGIADEITLAKIDELMNAVTFTQYNLTLNEAVSRQQLLNPPPQTDLYRNNPGFIHSSLVQVVERGAVNTNNVRLRTGPRLTSSIAFTVNEGATVTILAQVTGDRTSGSNIWFRINFQGQTLYVHSSLVNPGTRVAVTTGSARIRDAANTTNSHTYATVSNGTELVIRREVTGATVSGNNRWFEVAFNRQWKNARPSDFIRYLDPNQNDQFQHLRLDSSVGVSASQLNKILSGQGILHGMGQAFIEGGRRHSVNEIYLISHALLETGNGTSALATGIEVGVNRDGELELVTSSNRSRLRDIETTYNMFGIGANDNAAHRLGAFRAYREGWFTPEEAIIGGVSFISTYITRGQNTLYKMRWNHLYQDSRGTFPQYATDMGWAVKQVPRIQRLYDQLDNPILRFDIVQFRN